MDTSESGAADEQGLRGRTIVVAGAGGGGIGTAVCVALAAAGAVVAGFDNDPDKLALSETAVAAAGGSFHSTILDLRDPVAVQNGVDRAAAETGDLFGLVVVAGGLLRTYWARLTDTTPDDFDEVVEIEHESLPFVVGVQWHPEVADGGALFTAFVRAAARRRAAAEA